MVLSSRFVLVPFNSQTAMCKSLSPFFIILALNSSSVHGFCGKPVIIFRLQFPRAHPLFVVVTATKAGVPKFPPLYYCYQYAIMQLLLCLLQFREWSQHACICHCCMPQTCNAHCRLIIAPTTTRFECRLLQPHSLFKHW
jgi:hypothetical protein